MGLDTTHNAWHGPYSSFNEWRRFLGKQIGINLNDYIGYGNPNATLQLGDIPHKLQPLFDHSDCDGDLTPEQCKSIADGLTEVMQSIEPDNGLFSMYTRCVEFRDGCLLAHSKNEKILFQ